LTATFTFRRDFQALCLFCLILGQPIQGHAGKPAFSLHGFGTLGLARSTDDSAEFVRDLSQRNGLTEAWSFETDSVLGLQANLHFNPEFEGVVQAASHYNPHGDFKPELTWAFLSYAPSPAVTLRAGRLGNEFYMLADSRLVGYSYVTVRPPVDYFGTLPFDYFDGLDLAITRPLAGGLFKAKAYAGLSREQSPWAELQFNMSGSLLAGAYLDFIKGSWQFRLGHANLQFDRDLPVEDFYDALPPNTADELRVADKSTSFTAFGAVYDSGPLQTQFMLSRTLSHHGVFQDAWAGYLILSYRMHALTPFVGLSAAKSSPKDLDHPIPGYTDVFQAEFYNDQRTLFLGTRWDFMENFCLKAQMDIVRGKPESRFLYRWENLEDWDGSMTVLSVTLDFIF